MIPRYFPKGCGYNPKKRLKTVWIPTLARTRTENERMLADLETSRMKFASAATDWQTLKDEIDQMAQYLSPEEQKWIVAA